ncbi:heavy metal transport protein [Bordetella pertussis]|nr:heavy metal transport protein [Bordetella pertussis]
MRAFRHGRRRFHSTLDLHIMGRFKLSPTFENRTLSAGTRPALIQEKTMTIAFHVPDMTCGHCVKSITQAVQARPGDPRRRLCRASSLISV